MLVRNDDYWGDKAKLDKLIFRPIADNAARLQALQTGEIQGYDLVEPQDIETIEGDDNLQILDRPAFNVGYVGDQPEEAADRQARGAAGDRARPRPPGGRGQLLRRPRRGGEGVHAAGALRLRGRRPEYAYDPAKAKQLLQKAGVTLPVQVDFWYPTDVSRPYMPDPKRNFEAFAASLNKSGFKVVPHSAPWSPDYLGRVDDGQGRQLSPPRLDRRLRRPRQLHRHVLPEPEHAVGLQERGDLRRSSTRPRPETDAAKRDRALPGGEPGDHEVPARASPTCTRSRRSRSDANVKGYVPSPVSLEPFAHRRDRDSRAELTRQPADDVDVQVHRPPAVCFSSRS